MLGRLTRLSTHAKLAAVALVLGFVALLVGEPAGGRHVTLDTAELARLVEAEVDHVTPDTLASWILEGRQDFRLIDLRAVADYETYRIPGAERLSIPDLVAADLPRNEKIVLYSAEGIHSAQAWFLLAAERYPAVYILLGGLSQWNEQVLFPVHPGDGASPADLALFERAAARARSFGGAPRAAVVAGAPQALAPAPPALPKVAPPPAAPAGAGGARKKKEGC